MKFCRRHEYVNYPLAAADNFSTISQIDRFNRYEEVIFHNLSLLNWLSLTGQPFSIQWLAERWRVSQKVNLFTLQNLPHVPHLPPKYPHPNSHYQPLTTKTVMRIGVIATGVASPVKLDKICPIML
jgi:hypothetical protein